MCSRKHLYVSNLKNTIRKKKNEKEISPKIKNISIMILKFFKKQSKKKL